MFLAQNVCWSAVERYHVRHEIFQLSQKVCIKQTALVWHYCFSCTDLCSFLPRLSFSCRSLVVSCYSLISLLSDIASSSEGLLQRHYLGVAPVFLDIFSWPVSIQVLVNTTLLLFSFHPSCYSSSQVQTVIYSLFFLKLVVSIVGVVTHKSCVYHHPNAFNLLKWSATIAHL